MFHAGCRSHLGALYLAHASAIACASPTIQASYSSRAIWRVSFLTSMEGELQSSLSVLFEISQLTSVPTGIGTSKVSSVDTATVYFTGQHYANLTQCDTIDGNAYLLIA